MKTVLSRSDYLKFNLMNGLLSLSGMTNADNFVLFANGLYGLYTLDEQLMSDRDLTLAASDTTEWGVLTAPSQVPEQHWDEYLEMLQPHQKEFVQQILKP